MLITLSPQFFIMIYFVSNMTDITSSLPEIVDMVTETAKKVVDQAAPVVKSIVKSVNETVGGVVKQDRPLLNAIKDAGAAHH